MSNPLQWNAPKKLRIYVQFLSSRVQTEVDLYIEHALSNDNAVSSKLQGLQKEITANVDMPDELMEHYSEQYSLYETEYAGLANNGALVNLYSYFEHRLKVISRMVDLYVKGPPSFKPNSQDAITKQSYDTIQACTPTLSYASLEPEWVSLDHYRYIRNMIVHRGANYRDVKRSKGKSKSQIDAEIKAQYDLLVNHVEIAVNEGNGDFFIKETTFTLEYGRKVKAFLTKLLLLLNTLDSKDIL